MMGCRRCWGSWGWGWWWGGSGSDGRRRGKQSASGTRLDVNDRPTWLYKAVSVQLWYAPSASGPQILIFFFFLGTCFVCVCLFGPSPFSQMNNCCTIEGGEGASLSLVGDLKRGVMDEMKSGDFTR